MDVTLARLRIPTRDASGMPLMNLPEGCSAFNDAGLPRDWCGDEEAFHSLASQMGFALMPPVLSPARTTGYGGLYVGVEGWITGIDPSGETSTGRRYWEEGTEGEEASAGRNRFPSSTLIWSRFAIRKGFPLGFELGMSFAKLLSTSYWAYGLEVKWAILEGFRYGVGTALPDLAVRGMVNTMVGESEFNLTVPTFDVILSKRITIAGTGTITPMIAWQIGWIFADSELVDLTPGMDAFADCRPDPANPTTACTGPAGGADYNNNTTFDELRAPRQRLAIGVRGQYQALEITASFTFDLVKPGDQGDETPDHLPRQWSAAAGIGLAF